MRTKGETVDEITGFAEAMREHVLPVTPTRTPIVDVVGTGGDGARTFNISTAAGVVAAAAGAAVAKHGNRAASSACGSADVLEELGLALELPPERIAASIDEHGFGFMFARAHHPAMRHAAPVRQELGTRTVFNVLGPLANPAGARDGVFGVYAPELARTYAEALAGLGASRALVVHGAGGIDELTPSGPNLVVEVADGKITRGGSSTRATSGSSVPTRPSCAAALRPRTPRRSAASWRASTAAKRDAVLLNAAGALVTAGLAADLGGGRRRRGARRRHGRGRRDPRAARRVLQRGAGLMGRFAEALRAPGLGAIAEIKRRSPSAGDLRPGADPARIARVVWPGRRGRRLGPRRRALRRHVGRPPRGTRRERRAAPRQGLLLHAGRPADGEGGGGGRGAPPAARPRRRHDGRR